MAGKRPNFLIFMTDQQQGATILESNPCKTPNIDRFRRRAVHFTNAYCPSPHCCPSRATLYTGLYPSEHGVWNNVNVDNALSRGPYDGVRTFTQDLKENGYDLYFSGKWHISNAQPPSDYGFDILHCCDTITPTQNKPQDNQWQVYPSKPIVTEDTVRRQGEILRPGYPEYRAYGRNEHPFADEQTVQYGVAQLEALKDSPGPFLLYVGTTGPHSPYLVPQRFLDLYPPGSIPLPESFADPMEDKPALYRRTRNVFSQLPREEQEECLRHYYAFCSYEDYLFGQLLDALERSGHADDTVVLYLSDHGDYCGAHGLWGKGLPCFREAYHICAMIGGVGIQAPGRTESRIVTLADIGPTILELAAVKPLQPMAGRSLVPFLLHSEPVSWREYGFTQTNGNEIYGIQRSVWNQRWKFVYNTFDFDELYDLQKDPDELHNLLSPDGGATGPYREVVRAMYLELWRFARRTHDGIAGPYIMTALASYGPGILFEENG